MLPLHGMDIFLSHPPPLWYQLTYNWFSVWIFILAATESPVPLMGES